MRVNAKELDILKGIKKKDHLEQLEKERRNFVGSAFSPVTEFLVNLPNTAVYYIGGQLAGGGSMNASDLNGFRIAMNSMIESARQVYSTIVNLSELEDRRFEPAFNLMNVLNRVPRIGIDGGWKPKRRPKQQVDPKTKLKRVLDHPDYRLSGDVEFCDVSFKYNGMRKRMLNTISFKVKAGSFVGICGERGAGKTTMFKLLLRLYDPETGVVKVGGRDIKEYNPVWLRSQIGLSKQDPAIFTDYGNFSTLRANLMYATTTLPIHFDVVCISPLEVARSVASYLRYANVCTFQRLIAMAGTVLKER